MIERNTIPALPTATATEADTVMVAPLLRLYRCDVPDQTAFIAELRRHLQRATVYQLERALEKITRTHRYKTFPAIGEIMAAVDASPLAPPREAKFERPGPVPSARPPFVALAERYVADYERADAKTKASMEASQPGRLEAARRTVRAWSSPAE